MATQTDVSESTITVTAAAWSLMLMLQKDLSLAGVMINCSYLNKHFDTWKLRFASWLVDQKAVRGLTGCDGYSPSVGGVQKRPRNVCSSCVIKIIMNWLNGIR